ncbi:putative cystathionine gamma-synthase [Cercophora samala]|uniref:Cystathionine gamma-synthase n=1 Tax=Cercophora samala TaxID=330535 RepID=A0AA39YU44_9PEZI|nr:putative cystathionine gamma-synthase [Cercophora samala]
MNTPLSTCSPDALPPLRVKVNDNGSKMQSYALPVDPADLQLGDPLPPNDPHAISVHLPTWNDTLGWVTKDPSVLHAMKTGYPRFFMPRVVDQLGRRLAGHVGVGDEGTPMVFASKTWGEMFERYMGEDVLAGGRVWGVNSDGQVTAEDDKEGLCLWLAVVVGEPKGTEVSKARMFWQHTGYGISSRRAVFWLERASFLKRGLCREGQEICNGIQEQPSSSGGHNCDGRSVDQAKQDISNQIAGLLSDGDMILGKDDVLLYPGGMAAISELIATITDSRPPVRTEDSKKPKVAVFGFLYVDTIKVLERVHNCQVTVYGYSYTDTERFERRLHNGEHFHAVFTEFTGNPLLQSPHLERLTLLRKSFGFVLAVDDTVGTAACLRVLRHCDVVCTSLTKMFSGKCNVMGGSLGLNPKSTLYTSLRQGLHNREQDQKNVWYWEDVLVMAENCQTFETRIEVANENALAVVELLEESPVVKKVFYPSLGDKRGYDDYKRPGAGYGFLLSITFKTEEKAVAFYNGLNVAKGPSLGTNFTLCCAYTLLAHYNELDRAAQFGVEEYLVRISVGVEERGWLLERVKGALEAALLV